MPADPRKPASPKRPASKPDPSSSAAKPAGGFSFRFGDAKADASGAEGLLGGLANLLRGLTELAEKGDELKKSGNFTTPSGKDVNFTYGVSVRTLGDGGGLKVEPFGNLKRDNRTGEAVVQEVREPITDIFPEADHTKVVLEMPGVTAPDISAELDGDILTVAAERGQKRYRKEILLPAPARAGASPAISCNSGVVEIRIPT